uniref:Protein diaphanous homolog 3 n=2 Tax=Cacopsylla melanoneura TaxID=428564 RepID=A0A8D8WRH5_9HEMI
MSRSESNKHKSSRSGSFLDGMFSRPKNKGSGGVKAGVGTLGPSGDSNLIRQNSEMDLQDIMDEQELLLEKLKPEELNQKFEDMLNDMNLSDEKKEPLRRQPLANKKKMLLMHYKGMVTSCENKNKFDKPLEYIQYLGQAELSVNKLYACVESLRIALTNNPLSWVNEFGINGLKSLLSILNVCYRNDSRYDRVQYECVRCIRAIMNNTVGLKQMFGQKEALTIVARSLDPSKQSVMLEAVKVLAAVCLIPPEGHDKAIKAITMAGEMKGKERFEPVIQGLMHKNEPLRTACLQLINAIVATPDDLEFRLHLRNEIMRVGLYDMLDQLKEEASDDVSVQLKVFIEHKDDDYDEFIQRFDNVRLEIDDVNDCFETVRNMVMDSSCEPYLLSILQHLLFIRDDQYVRLAYYKLLEECVSQIVLHRGGCDPDFRSSRRFQLDVQPLVDKLAEQSKTEEDRRVEELNLRLDEAIMLRQEAEAQLVQAQKTLEDFTSGKPMEKNRLEEVKAQVAAGIPTGPKGGGPPPPPPPPGGMGPPPPPMPGGGGPPPPPMPGMGGPPPPPMPGMGPPPPPLPGMGPPPPPGGPLLMKPADVLPHYLKPKKKWEVGPIKRANWKTINAQKLSEKSFWVKLKEEELASPDILSGLAQKFSSKPANKKSDDNVDKCGTLKRVKALKILDSKAAQNLSILLGGSLKHYKYEQVKLAILRCDTNILSGNVLEQLISYLPPPDQLQRLKELSSDYANLTEAEQFAVTIAEIKRLLPRLKSMHFKQHFVEMYGDTHKNIIYGKQACEEVKQSKKLAKILELILLMGNYMNSGSRNGGAFGFEINFLTKLSSTKDIENKSTLLHYLVDTIENKFPECLKFSDELLHVDRAARVSTDVIQNAIRQMENNIKNLETDIQNCKLATSTSEEDQFLSTMEPFAKEVRSKVTLLSNMFKNMMTLYSDLAEFFTFDKTIYPLEEFFTDIKTFKDAFYQAWQDNTKIREAEEKSIRVREAREKAESEKKDKAARKKALIDMTTDQTQQGVMDSLLEALQTGSAFNREQRRKRNNDRPVGAERRAQLNRSRSRNGIVITRELGNEVLIGNA